MIVKVRELKKKYGKENNEFEALKGIELSINEGEFISIMGESGSGKSTLLNIIAGFDSATSGSVLYDNTDITKLSENDKAKFRQGNIGFVFQSFCLLSDLSALENVMMPMLMRGISKKEAKEKAVELLKLVKLGNKLNNMPEELSGGQQQRVAIVRALATDPPIILADEPTGKLDSENAREILELLFKINKQYNKTIVMVTHSQKATKYSDKIVFIKDGKIDNICDNKDKIQ